MKNVYQNTIKKLLFLGEKLIILALEWRKSFKKDLSFYNENTELLAIWTLLFTTITGLFYLGIKIDFPAAAAFIVLLIVIVFGVTILTIFYLHAVNCSPKRKFLFQIHLLLNKSFKLRTGLKFIKLPNAKHLFKLKLNFKLAS